MRFGIRALAALTALGLLVAVAPSATAQRQGRGGGGGGGRGGLRVEPAPPTLGPGEYSLDFDKVLEAIDRGEGSQALAYYERVAVAAEQKGERVPAARAYGAAAVVALRLGRFQRAIQAGSHAIELFKGAKPDELLPSDVRRVASVYAQVGQAYRQAGDLAQARKVLEEGLEFTTHELTGRREGAATALLSKVLAGVAYAQRDYATALARANQAATFFVDLAANLPARAPERRKAGARRQAADSLATVAHAELALGHLDLAEAAYDRAFRYAQLVGLREVELDVVKGRAGLALSRQEWSKALGLFEQGLTLAQQIRKPSALLWLNYGKARALGGLGRSDEALAAAREAVRYVEELRGELGDSGLRSGFLEDKQAIYQHAVRLAIGAQRPDEAFDLAERSRARAFLDLLGNGTTLSKGRTRALVEEEGRLRARLAELQARSQDDESAEGGGVSRAEIEAADRDYRAFLERVRKENLEQASLMTVEPVTLAEIQRLLPDGTTLLEYLVGERDTLAWVVDRGQATVVRTPVSRAALIRQVRGLRASIAKQAPQADVEAKAMHLYKELLEPARSAIHGQRLLIVPHGVLHYLPFAALRSPAGRWLVEDFPVSTLPSASVLRYLGDKGTGATGPPLVIGNPDVGAGLALHWAEREARLVGREERGATVLVRGDATERRVKTLLESAGLAHFATHGELNESDPLASALLLVPGDGEDGRLEVRELFGLDLHARLVVLSACETGLGKLSRGDELVGLQRAFLYAGTPAVVTTLWKVDDRASYELIRAFYERLDSAGAVEALRQAQLETMRAFPHPFAWAAFGLSGVPR
jgi:CHAT domain-containing protein